MSAVGAVGSLIVSRCQQDSGIPRLTGADAPRGWADSFSRIALNLVLKRNYYLKYLRDSSCPFHFLWLTGFPRDWQSKANLPALADTAAALPAARVSSPSRNPSNMQKRPRQNSQLAWRCGLRSSGRLPRASESLVSSLGGSPGVEFGCCSKRRSWCALLLGRGEAQWRRGRPQQSVTLGGY